MRLLPRSRFAIPLWAAALLAVLTVACTSEVEPQPGAQLIHSGPVDAAAQPPVVVQQAPSPAAQTAALASPVPTTPVAAAPAASSPVARMASPAPTSSVGDQRSTAQATFLVSNTLGRGMALRSSPVARDPGKSWPDGTRMRGLGAEQEAYGWTWRFVRDPEGNVGWAPSNYLIQDESASAPTSTGGLLPPSAPPTLIIVPTRGLPEATPTAGPAMQSTPTGSPAPARAPQQNASAPQADSLTSTLRSISSGSGGLPSGLPAILGGR